MKKFKALAALLAALTLSVSGVAAAGCNTKKPCNHVDADYNGVCDICDKDIPAVVAEEGVDGIVMEWEGLGNVTLTEAAKTYTLDTSKLKVYLAKGSTKGAELTKTNYTITVNKSGSPVSELSGLGEGNYEVIIAVKNVNKADGTAADWEDFKSFAITNPVKANSFAKSSTGDTTCEQASNEADLYANWTYSVTLNNGDTKAVSAADVTVSGVSTVTPGTRKATVTYGDDSIEVEYTVTAKDGMTTQSYAVSANTLTIGEYTSETVLNADGGISITGKSDGKVAVDANSKSIDGKSFTQRIKLNGSPIKNGALNGTTLFRTVKFADVNKTTVEGATSKTIITVYAASGSSGTERNLSLYKEGENEGKPTLTKVEGQTAAVNDIIKCVYEIEDKGTFHIASESSGINIYYIQVDKIMTGETGSQNVPLGGEDKAISLSLNTGEAKLVYKKGGTLDTSGVTATATVANDVTAESKKVPVANANLSFSTVDMSTIGEKTVTVTYGEGAAAITATYKVTVETEVDGVKDATATVGLASTEVETDDAKLTVTKSDIKVAAVWTGDAVDGVTVTYTVKSGDTVVDETGLEFAVGTHTLTVEITISNGSQTANLTKEVELKVTKKAGEGELSNVKLTVDAAMVESVGKDAITSAKVLAEGITLGLSNKAGSSNVTIGGTTYSNYVQIAGTFKATDKDTKSIKLEVQGAATIKVICKTSSADRILNLYNVDGTKIGDGSDASNGVELTFTVDAAGTYYLGSGNSSINIYQIEIIYS